MNNAKHDLDRDFKRVAANHSRKQVVKGGSASMEEPNHTKALISWQPSNGCGARLGQTKRGDIMIQLNPPQDHLAMGSDHHRTDRWCRADFFPPGEISRVRGHKADSRALIAMRDRTDLWRLAPVWDPQRETKMGRSSSCVHTGAASNEDDSEKNGFHYIIQWSKATLADTCLQYALPIRAWFWWLREKQGAVSGMGSPERLTIGL